MYGVYIYMLTTLGYLLMVNVDPLIWQPHTWIRHGMMMVFGPGPGIKSSYDAMRVPQKKIPAEWGKKKW